MMLQRQASHSLQALESLEKSLGSLKLKRSKLRSKQAGLSDQDAYGAQLYAKKLALLDASVDDLQARKEDAFRVEFFDPEKIPLVAAAYGVVKVLQDFVTRMTPATSAYLEQRDETTGSTPLLVACGKGYVDCAKILIAVGALVGAVNNTGATALHCAAAAGHPEIVQLLLAVPYFDPYVRNQRQLTALSVARIACLEHDHWASFEECARLLEERCSLYRGWLYESVESSVVKMPLGLRPWKLRFVIVLRTDVRSTSLELSFFDAKQGSRLPPVPISTVVYKLGTPMVMPGTQRPFGNKDHSFYFAGAHRTHEDQPTVMRKLECAALDANGLASWSTFFETYSTTKDVPDTLLVPLAAATPSPHATETPSVLQQVPRRSRRSLSELTLSESNAVGHAAPSTAATPSVLQLPWRSRRSHSDAKSPVIESSSMLQVPWRHQSLPEPKQLALPEPEVPRDVVPSAPLLSPVNEAVAASAPPLDESGLLEAGRQRECVVCFDGPQSAVCVPCGHNAVCMRCADHLLAAPVKQCPVCRSPVREIIRLFQC
ncbi:hypothetical protein SDRG_00123 [Saprolegnia diclina VS20]|uniref:RING-type domain-containing protein n=1 Tax=Saprolegnia diclina (strain VS20) TaxID=1156394 RepID=T0R623_SAPDV|nr:hypothetical protein SDRG_00123 [Saprolegnia diclina VS20]EQC42386.1 hypothetical protein SDRG_00123 [Saprolegnia diclina VS20]|eukprot:XP_008603809.1 hypothetical protein SDRG_00123 [Saprolegnia diclina VS20]